jgi:hypothetical protein
MNLLANQLLKLVYPVIDRIRIQPENGWRETVQGDNFIMMSNFNREQNAPEVWIDLDAFAPA